MVYVCNLKSCKYSVKRLDLFNRYLRTVHQNEKKVCECGKKVQSGNLARHKSTACPVKNQEKATNEDSIESNQSIDYSDLNVGNNPFDERNKICIDVQLIILKDGTILLMHDNIGYFGIPLILSAIHGNKI